MANAALGRNGIVALAEPVAGAHELNVVEIFDFGLQRRSNREYAAPGRAEHPQQPCIFDFRFDERSEVEPQEPRVEALAEWGALRRQHERDMCKSVWKVSTS